MQLLKQSIFADIVSYGRESHSEWHVRKYEEGA